jgi:predicted ArsR family transcriptional regulator
MSNPTTPSRRANAHARAARHRLLADPSRMLIVDALTEGPCLMGELVERAGVHRNTVRAHLARLIDAGVVERERVARPGPGRPAERYRLREAIAPSGVEQRLLISALVRLVASAYEAGAEEQAREEGLRIGRQLGAAHPQRTVSAAVQEVTRLLRDLSFAPQLAERARVSDIELRSCPFAVSPDDPRGTIICAFHLGLIRGVLETSAPSVALDVRLLPHVGPSLCRAEIRYSESA